MKDGPGLAVKSTQNVILIIGDLSKLKLNKTILWTLKNPLYYKPRNTDMSVILNNEFQLLVSNQKNCI